MGNTVGVLSRRLIFGSVGVRAGVVSINADRAPTKNLMVRGKMSHGGFPFLGCAPVKGESLHR